VVVNVVGVDHDVPFHVVAMPLVRLVPTATQKLDDAHDTLVRVVGL
jgi:hypothetical protein